MKTRLGRLSAGLVAVLVAVFGPALGVVPTVGEAAAAKPFTCPKATHASGRLLVYGVGSSTMGHPLGQMLRKELEPLGIDGRHWGKASSGLARPDFWDWAEKIPGVAAKHDPDVWVVALGGNDNQGLIHFVAAGRKGRLKRRWVNFNKDAWGQIYAKRVDRLLDLMSGPERRRAIVWMGPVGFFGRSVTWGQRVSDIMRERVEAFDGPAVFVDLFGQTVVNKRALSWFQPPGAKRRVKLRGGDKIHLSRPGVRWLMVEPVLELLRPCAANSGSAHD